MEYSFCVSLEGRRNTVDRAAGTVCASWSVYVLRPPDEHGSSALICICIGDGDGHFRPRRDFPLVDGIFAYVFVLKPVDF